MSRKTLPVTVRAVLGDPSSLDPAGAESEFDSGRELESKREPDSGRELDSERESYTGTSDPSHSPSTPYQMERAGSSLNAISHATAVWSFSTSYDRKEG